MTTPVDDKDKKAAEAFAIEFDKETCKRLDHWIEEHKRAFLAGILHERTRSSTGTTEWTGVYPPGGGNGEQPAERDWKWEYENLCKFASDFQDKLSAAQAEIAELEETRKAWKQLNRALSDKLAEAVSILERQQKSDDWCNRPFNEDIGEFLAKIKGTEKP